MPANLAIVGISGPVGLLIGAQADADRDVRTIIGVDDEPPRQTPSKCKYVPLGAGLADTFKSEKVGVAVYLSPYPAGGAAAELPAEPALDAFFRACKEAETKTVLVASGPFVYQVAAMNEGLATEGAPIRRDEAGGGLGGDDIRRERAVASFAKANSGVDVLLVRLAPLLGPSTQGFGAQLLESKKLLMLRGSPPRLQFLHAEDAAVAIYKLLKNGGSGPYNIAPDDTITLAEIGRSLRRPVEHIAPWKARAFAGAASLLGLRGFGGVSPAMLPLLSCSVALANKKLKRDLKYRFKYACSGAISEHTGRGGGRPL